MSARGLARIGTRDITRMADSAEGTLYKHFRKKDDIIIEVLERNVPRFRETLRDLPLQVGQKTVKENLERVAMEALEYSSRTAPLICSLFADVALLKRTRDKLTRSHRGPERSAEVLAVYLSAEQRLGRISKNVNPSAAAAFLFNAIFGLAVFEPFVGRLTDRSNRRDAIADIVSTILIGLEPRPHPLPRT
jgi:AcrR family transcriptional regulator